MAPLFGFSAVLLSSFKVMVHTQLVDVTFLTRRECWAAGCLGEKLELLVFILLGWLVKEASHPQCTAGNP